MMIVSLLSLALTLHAGDSALPETSTQTQAAPPSSATPTPGPTPTLVPAATPTPASASELLHLDEAVRAALSAHPNIRQAQAQVQSAEAKASQARAGLLPQLSAAAGYQRDTANQTGRVGSTSSALPLSSSAAGWKTYDYYSGSLTLSQLLFDFGGTWDRWEAAQASARGQRDSETATRLATILTARAAFLGASGAKALLRVAEATLANQQSHLRQIQGYVGVGQRPQIDLVQARTDVANAEVQRIQADNAYRTAKVQLNQAMGRDSIFAFEVADDELPAVDGEDAPAQGLIDEALRARPEIAALDQQISGQELQIRGITAAYLPSLQASTSMSDAGDSPKNLTWNWSIQANATWPIFQGGLTRAQAADASATLALLTAQRDAQKQQASLDVERARLSVTATKAALGAAAQALQNANERLGLAEARYRAGVGNIIELGDAQLAQSSAAAQQVQAQYALATARAQLLFALGRP